MSDFSQGAGDVARSAYGNIGDTYQAFLQGQLAPQAEMTGDMVTVGPAAEDIAQSYDAALREHQAMEQQEQLDNGSGPYVGFDQSGPDQSEPGIG